MKPIYAGEDIWLRAETANEKLKQDAQSQNYNSMQTKSVLYMTQLEAISLQYYVSWEGVGDQSHWPPQVCAEALDTQHAVI